MKRLNRRLRFSQKRSLGQVFLREDWPCRKLADILDSAGVQSVLEIGPGPGILTKELLRNRIDVTAVEKDDRLAERLLDQSKSFRGQGSFEVLNQDILSFDLAAWMQQHSGQRLAVCGNIPYNISSPILNWLLPHLGGLKTVVIMVQLEFAERVVASPGNRAYGSLSVYVQLRADVRLEYMVPRACFTPVPAVDSAVISLRPGRGQQPEPLLRLVERLTRKSFSYRRKKLSNSLAPFIPEIPPEEIGLDLNRRCETVSPAEFLELARRLESRSGN